MKSQTFEPVWRCIYCGKTKQETNLTREHIIPFGFAGSLILPRASCLACADITKKFEQFLQRDMYGLLRAHLNLPTRRPDERPKTWPLTFYRGADQTNTETIDIPVEEYPYMFAMPVLPQPGLLEGKKDLGGWAWLRIADSPIGKDRGDQLVRRLRRSANETIGFLLSTDVHLGVLAKSFSKIAHGYAVAKYGYDGFDHFLPDLILGKKDNAADLFGNCAQLDLSIGDGKDMHEIFLVPVFIEGETLLVAQVQLFARYHAPTFQVVVGKLRKTESSASSSSSKPSTQ
jgi:hypothetical protein